MSQEQQSIDAVCIAARDLLVMLQSDDHAYIHDEDLRAIWYSILQSVMILSKALPPASVAQLISALPLSEPGTTTYRDGQPLPRPNRRVALAAAEILGPDGCQLLYHFAVLVTKLS